MFIDPILVAVPKGHRLADRTSISLTELRDECFVGVKRGYGTRDPVDSICKSKGFIPAALEFREVVEEYFGTISKETI